MICWGQIDEHLKAALVQAGLDSVNGAFAFGQGKDLVKSGLGTRRRTRLSLTDAVGRSHELYLKRYGPLPWPRRLGKFTSPAAVEFRAIEFVRQAQVPAPRALLYGQECPLCDGRSFLVLTAVAGEAIERGGARYFEQSGPVQERATDRLAELVRALHGAGLVHRDLYASHVFAHEAQGKRVELNLIDLARVFRPRWRQFRWRVKDLAALHFSMPPAWTLAQWSRFLRQYLGPVDPRQQSRWERAILNKSAAMRHRHQRHQAAAGGER